MPIASDRNNINPGAIASIGTEQLTPAVGDLMAAFRNGFITVDDITRRGLSLPVEAATQQQNLQDQVQIRPLARQAQTGALASEIAIQPKKSANAAAATDLQGRQITEAGRQLPTPDEVQGQDAARAKSAKLLNAISSTIPGVREKALAEASAEQVTDLWVTSHGVAAPDSIEIPGTGVTPKPIEEWVIEKFGPNALAVDAQAVLARPDVQQGYAAYTEEAKNRPDTVFKGDPRYVEALKNDLKAADLKNAVQAAQVKALPGVYEAKAKAEADIPGRVAKVEGDLVSESTTRLKQFREQAEAYQKISGLGAKTAPTNADDLALIYAYIKLLDPGSVVREGEIKLTQAATPLTDRLGQQYRRLFSNSGGVLDPSIRKDYLAASETLFKSTQEATRPEIERISATATSRGADINNVLTSTERGLLNPGAAPAPAAGAPSVKVGDTVVLKDGRRVKVKAVTATGIIPE